MTDLVIGLLFVFIIMLMFFALQYQSAERQSQEAEQRNNEQSLELARTNEALKRATKQLFNAEEVRRKILENLYSRMSEQGIKVDIDPNQGILRLGEDILFDKGKADITSQGDRAVAALANALAAVLPCYTIGGLSATASECPQERALVNSIYIEGHTDNDPLTRKQLGMSDNLDLSAIRATNTFRALLEKKSDLLAFHNREDSPVLSVSGYGEYRPIERDQPTESLKRKNRRIDLRILMSTPRSEDARRLEDEIQMRPKEP